MTDKNLDEKDETAFEKWDLSLICQKCNHHYTWHDKDYDTDEEGIYTSCSKKDCDCDEYEKPKEFSKENSVRSD